MLAQGRARRSTGKKTNGGCRGRRTNRTTGLSIKEKKVKQWSKANTAAKVFYCFVFAVVSSSMFLRPFINKKKEGLCERNCIAFFGGNAKEGCNRSRDLQWTQPSLETYYNLP